MIYFNPVILFSQLELFIIPRVMFRDRLTRALPTILIYKES